jgi:hypothetical protein
MAQRFRLTLSLLRNYLDYPLRQLFRWRRKGLRLANEPKEDLFSHLPEPGRSQTQKTANRLLTEYHLESMAAASTKDNYRENLYYLEMVESALAAVDPPLPQQLIVGDIGPSHWFYVRALYAALKWWREPAGREVTLTGFEKDAYRVYSDFYSRYDHALAFMDHLPGVEYKPVGFKAQPAAFDVITLFFPFIFMPDHLEWGLPSSMFDPSILLGDAWLSLRQGGLLVIVNQGKAEQQTQLEILKRAGIPVNASFLFDSALYYYDIPRFITVAYHDHDTHHSG